MAQKVFLGAGTLAVVSDGHSVAWCTIITAVVSSFHPLFDVQSIMPKSVKCTIVPMTVKESIMRLRNKRNVPSGGFGYVEVAQGWRDVHSFREAGRVEEERGNGCGCPAMAEDKQILTLTLTQKRLRTETEGKQGTRNWEGLQPHWLR